MRKLSLFIFLISTTMVLNAQTQITFSDFANILAPGKEWLEVSNDSVHTIMNIGSASGSSQNWIMEEIITAIFQINRFGGCPSWCYVNGLGNEIDALTLSENR